MIALCTLFDTNYIDKGITMFESIERYTQDFVLYVLCMDSRCYEILSSLDYARLVPIALSDFESKELLALKAERSVGEYCWTCSSSLVDYIMNKYSPDYCAYIDSDLYFYDDVNIVIDEMNTRNASVMIVGHRFNSYEAKAQTWRVGRYCVEFNTFKNDNDGRRLLTIWKNQCLDYCKCDGDGIHWGDQKYMDGWCDDYSFCVETANLGSGIAPWNFAQYKLCKKNLYGPTQLIADGRRVYPFFYHFQNMNYISTDLVKANAMTRWGVDKKLLSAFYKPYLIHLRNNKLMLKDNYKVDVLMSKHPGINIENKPAKSFSLRKLFNVSSLINKVRCMVLFDMPTRMYRKYDYVRID